MPEIDTTGVSDRTTISTESVERLIFDSRSTTPRQSPTYRKALERSTGITVAGGFVTGLSLLALFSVNTVAYSFRFNWSTYYTRMYLLCVIGVLLVGVAIMATGQLLRIRARLRFFSDAAEDARDRAIDDLFRQPPSGDPGDDLSELLRSTRDQMQFYDAMAKSQAAKAFYLSVGAMVACLLIIIVGITISLTETNGPAKYTAASLAAIGSLTSGYISRTFLELHGRTMHQLSYYFQQPLVQSHALMAKRMTKDLSDNERDAAVRAIVDALLVNVARVTDGSIGPGRSKGE